MKSAKDYGIEAFHKGLTAPYQDKHFVDAFCQVQPGRATEPLNEWRAGFFGELEKLATELANDESH